MINVRFPLIAGIRRLWKNQPAFREEAWHAVFKALVLCGARSLGARNGLPFSGAANFGFGPLIAAGPTAVLVVTVMLLNPVLFGLLGVVKRESLWQVIAAVGMVTLLALYTLLTFGYFGPVFG